MDMKTLIYYMLRGRLFKAPSLIFPALIPFIEILPWLLALVGSLAGASSFIAASTKRIREHRSVLLIIMALCFLGGAGVYYRDVLFEKEPLITDAENLPTLTSLKTAPGFQPTPPPHIWSRPVRQWSARRDKHQFLSSPYIADGLLFIGTFGDALEARSLTDGSVIWKLVKHEPISAPPIVSGNTIYVGEGLHTAPNSGLTALSYPDGKPIWERRFPSHVESYPIVDDENKRLWIGAGTEGLWSLKTTDGTKIWQAAIGHIDSAPLYRNGQLFTSARLDEHANGSALFKLAPDTGEVIWSLPLQGNPMSNVISVNETRLLLNNAIGQIGLNKDTDAGWVYGIDISEPPSIAWKVKLPTMAIPDGQITRDKSVAVFGLKNGEIWALNPITGEILWTQKCGDEFKNNVELYEDGNIPFVIGLTVDGTVNVLNARTGYILQTFSVGTGGYSAPLYKDGMLYLTTPHFIHAYNITGKAANNDP
jgi:outer membrane protein assembly factor BamB